MKEILKDKSINLKSDIHFKAGDAPFIDEASAKVLNDSLDECLAGKGVKINSLDELWE